MSSRFSLLYRYFSPRSILIAYGQEQGLGGKFSSLLFHSFYIFLLLKLYQMNNQGAVNFHSFHFVQNIRVNVCISRKIHFQQRIVFLFGPERLREILLSPDPIILPLIDYTVSFDMHIFILFQELSLACYEPRRLIYTTYSHRQAKYIHPSEHKTTISKNNPKFVWASKASRNQCVSKPFHSTHDQI